MIYLFYGTDEERARREAHKLLEGLRAKKPDAPVFKLESDEFDEGTWQEAVHGASLFTGSYLVYGNKLSEESAPREFIQKNASAMKDSPNVIILLEKAPDKKTLTALRENAEKVHIFEAKEKEQKQTQNVFALTDALGARDRKRAWIEYIKALREGSAPEELHGLLFWQVKTMLLAKNASSAKEAGLKPFPYKKARDFLKNYSEGELKELSGELVDTFHNAHAGGTELDLSLERLLLKL